MMKRIILFIVLPLLFLTACDSGKHAGSKESLKPDTSTDSLIVALNLQSVIASGINVSDINIKVLLGDSLIREKRVPIENATAEIDFGQLIVGEYTVKASAYDGDSLIASGEGIALIRPNEATVLDLTLTFITGTLTINLDYEIPPTASYELRFVSTWSGTTHPLNFPSAAHFSGLTGGSHNANVSFWQLGELASGGIKSMAETGSKTNLSAEVEAARQAGTADTILSGDGLTSSPGEVIYQFTVHKDFPLVTLVSMLAPSPDWFVGVSGLNLIENGLWINSKSIDLVVHDAGTDSGLEYTSPDNATQPPEAISRLSAEGVGFLDGYPVVGQFHFTRIE